MCDQQSLTIVLDFCKIRGQHLFQVNAGVPAKLALEHASDLLEAINGLSQTVAMQLAHGGESFAVYHLSEMVKALVDAAAAGLPDSAGGDQ